MRPKRGRKNQNRETTGKEKRAGNLDHGKSNGEGKGRVLESKSVPSGLVKPHIFCQFEDKCCLLTSL
eukprot:6043356-Pleurochrysis_carterae.AAC.1